MHYRGVVLAGGQGTRLGELTRVVNKHLLPVGGEPMIYHPLRKLVGAGIRDILLVSGPEHLGDFVRQLGSGNRLACELTYRVQEEPGGIAQALALAEDFCAGGPCVLLLGDNVFFDPLGPLLDEARRHAHHATIFLKQVSEPARYGIAEIRGASIVSIEEKPARPRGDQAIVGIYVFPPDVFDVIRMQRVSSRGEFEITDVVRTYLDRGRLHFASLGGYWFDAGTLESWGAANQAVRDSVPRV